MASDGQPCNSQKPGMKRSRHCSATPMRSSKRHGSSESHHAVTLQVVPTGQTAPNVIQSLMTADRAHRQGKIRNPYLDPPPGFDQQFDASCYPPTHAACSHTWTTQQEQTQLPTSDIGDTDGKYRLACVCQKCRWHVDLQITHGAEPCPKEHFPLHHFTEFRKDNADQEWYRAQCSGCGAVLCIDYRGPRLQPEHIELLTNADILQRRFESARDVEPDRGNWAGPAQPLQVLDALVTYITDALKSEEEPKQIPKLNRRFVISLGEECLALLQMLEFKDAGEFIILPHPSRPDPWTWDLRKTLEDVQQELWALMREIARRQVGSDLVKLKGYRDDARPIDDDVQLLLSTFEYDKSKITRRAFALSPEECSWYAGLGAVAEFPDTLVEYSFDRQTATDSLNAPYYYDCLTKIAKLRNSEVLEMKVAMLASEGSYGREDVVKAYKYFALDPRQADELTDEHIRGVFESRLGSVAKSMEAETREKLRIIGLARGSRALIDAAANDFADWEAALRWLEPSYDGQVQLDDSYVTSLAAVKKNEFPEDKHMQDKINKAIKMIADYRDSAALRAWLTGNDGAVVDDDDLTAAYRFYNIADRSAGIDQSSLEIARDVFKQEDPTKANEADKFYNLLMAAPAKSVAPANYNLPVGLENNGNTCYLNALLQYLFAIAPFREIAINLDDFKQPLDDVDAVALGKVGGEPVTRKRVEDGQNLMRTFGPLFREMQTTAKASVTPSLELAAEALKAPPGTALITQHKRLSLAIEKSQTNQIKSDIRDTGVRRIDEPVSAEKADDSSDITLVDEVVMTPESEGDMDHTLNSSKRPDDEASRSMGRDSMEVEIGDGDEAIEPPTRPPPVPPRPQPHKPQLQDQIDEVVRQQDAHEVSSRLIQRALAAIAPDAVDADGERSDSIRNLFYGIYQQIVTARSPAHTSFPLSYDVSVFLQMIDKPKDIPEALDYYFGRDRLNMTIESTQKNEEIELYSVIKKAPPLLQLYLQNRSWDQKQAKMSRIAHNVELNETIYLDRYMEENNKAMLPLREYSWEIRDRLEKLEEERDSLQTTLDITSGDALDSIFDLVNTLEADRSMEKIEGDDTDESEALKASLQAQASMDRERLEELNTRIAFMQRDKAEVSYEDYIEQKYCYRLMAIFMHRGDGSFGHWWIHIRDFKNNIWREFNDQRVIERKDIADLLKARNAATQEDANYVIYVRDDLKDTLVDPLSRKKPEGDVLPKSESNDVEDVEMVPLL